MAGVMNQRVEMVAHWHVGHGLGGARDIVRRHFAENKMKIVVSDDVEIEAEGGSQILTRLFEMLLVPRSCYPTSVRIVLWSLDTGTSIDATIGNRSPSLSFMDPLARQRYTDHFEKWLEGLGKALT